jgi:hypothetical protein
MDSWMALWPAFADGVRPYLPPFLAALAIIVVAWIVARIARSATLGLGARLDLDQRSRSAGLTRTLSGVAAGLVWLLALPALLGTLGLTGLLEPVNAMLGRLLAFLPNLLGALVLLGLGWLIARLVSQIVAGVLTAAGSERLAARIGLAPALGEGRTLAGVAGSAVFALILLPTAAAALQTLGLDAVTQPITRLIDDLLGLLPRLLAAGIVLVVAVIVARALATLATTLLSATRFDRVPALLGAADDFRLGGRTASELGGVAVMVTVVVIAVVQAAALLGLPVLSTIVADLGAWLVRAAAAAGVMAVGLWLANLAAAGVRHSSVSHRDAMATAVRVAVLFVAACLALVQVGLSAAIVTILFASVVGAAALGLALAIGLALGVGGQPVVARWLDRTLRPATLSDGSASSPELQTAAQER